VIGPGEGVAFRATGGVCEPPPPPPQPAITAMPMPNSVAANAWPVSARRSKTYGTP